MKVLIMVQFNALDIETLTPGALPMAPVVKIVTTYTDGIVEAGSGVIVGKNDVLTAAHVVTGKGKTVQSISITPYYGESYPPTQVIWAGYVNFFDGFAENPNGTITSGDGNANSAIGSELDLAIIGTRTSLWEYGFLWIDNDYVPPTNNPWLKWGVLQGYPDSAGGALRTQEGSIVQNPVDNIYDISHFSYTSPGASGGPLWNTSGTAFYSNEVLGVVSTANTAAGTKQVADYLEKWMNSNDYLVENSGLVSLGRPWNETIVGMPGADQLNGGTGSDTIYGGAGSDIIVAGNSWGGGSITLGNYLDGGDGDDLIVGDIGADTILGGAGSDRIWGGGGRDRIVPGSGNDTIDGQDGIDTVSYHSQWNVTNGTVVVDLSQTVDIMTLRVGPASTFIQELWGIESVVGADSLDNWLIGSSEANALYGGANGRNTLEGGGDNDALFGGNLSDNLRGHQGNDTISGGAGHDIAVFEGQWWTYTINWTLDGGLAIQGADGTDIVYDVEVFQFADGVLTYDQVRPATPPPPPPGTTWTTSTSTTLPFGLSNMTATGSRNINLTGNFLDNIIKGNSGKNVLNGAEGNDTIWGMAGNDTLYGGTGKDVFVFSKKPGKANLDGIRDFNVQDDSIWLENAVFKKIGSGSASNPKVLSSKFFTVGDKAKDGNDHVIYNKKTGAIFYDADGAGGSSQVQFATLSKNLKLTNKDFFVI
jgi:Ca2+-binding RTX toxin-like protein